ncbi:hypothetical protein [Streptococcus parasanguinis]
MIDKKSSLFLNTITIIMHILLGGIGLAIYVTLGKDSELGLRIFVGIFILFKSLWFYYCSSDKKIVEKIANFFITIFFSLLYLLFLFYVILATVKLVHIEQFMFSNIFELLFYITVVVISIIVIPIIEKNAMKKITSGKILSFITIISFEIISSVLLYFVDTKESVIISAFTALLILFLTSENVEVLFNVKVTEYIKQQISLIRFYLIFLLPFMYIVSKYTPYPKNKNFDIRIILQIGATRLTWLLIIWGIMLALIYLKWIRRPVQKFLGLPSNQAKLNGNWVMIITNPFTKKDLIIRKFVLLIDGRRIKYNNKIFYFNENLEVFDEEEKKIGLIKENKNDDIVIELDNVGEDNLSPSKKKNSIKLIRVRSDEFKKFNHKYKIKKAVFKNIKISDPITNNELEVTIFICDDNKKYFLETNCKTQDKYELIKGNYVKLEDEEESFIESSLYDSDTFN